MVAYALARLSVGHTTRDVAKELTELGCQVSFVTIALWARKAKAALDPAHAPAPPKSQHRGRPPWKRPDLSEALAAKVAANAAKPPPEPVLDPSDNLGTLRTLAQYMYSQAAQERTSNPKLAATMARSAADVLNTIARVEKGQAEAEDLLRITRKQIADAKAGALERFQALCNRAKEAGGLLCARCSRQLSIEWGEAQAKVDEAEKSQGA